MRDDGISVDDYIGDDCISGDCISDGCRLAVRERQAEETRAARAAIGDA